MKAESRIGGLTLVRMSEKMLAVCVIMRFFRIDGILSFTFSLKENKIEKIIENIKRSPHYGQLRVLVLDPKYFNHNDIIKISKSMKRIKVIMFDDKLEETSLNNIVKESLKLSRMIAKEISSTWS